MRPLPACSPSPSTSVGPLRAPLFDAAPPNACSDISDDDLTNTFQRLVGSLIYLAVCSRPDISYAAMALGKYNSKPSRAHMLAAKGVLRYLKGTIDLALGYGISLSSAPQVHGFVRRGCGFSDADWASAEWDRRSISGYCFFYLNALVSWSAVGQHTISLSFTESEYCALSHAMKEALWMRRLLLSIISFPVPKPFPLLCDNQAAGCIASSSATSSRSEHIDIRYHFIREHISSGDFSTVWISTQEMTADIMTITFQTFLRHRKGLCLIPL